MTEKTEQQSAKENDDNEENAEEALLQMEELDLAEESDDDEIVLAEVCADSQLEAYENMMPEQQDLAETTGTVTVDDVLGPSTHADTQDCPTQRLAISYEAQTSRWAPGSYQLCSMKNSSLFWLAKTSSLPAQAFCFEYSLELWKHGETNRCWQYANQRCGGSLGCSSGTVLVTLPKRVRNPKRQ